MSGDMRRPRLDGLFDVDSESGLSELLAGDDSVDFVQSEVERLWVLPSGATPANPAELLSSDRTGKAITLMEEQFDIVFVDTPPVLATADAVTLAAHGLPVLLVVDGQSTEAESLTIVRSEFAKVGVTISGAILNRDSNARNGLWPFNRRNSYYANSSS